MATLEVHVGDIVAVAQQVACVLRSTPHGAGWDQQECPLPLQDVKQSSAAHTPDEKLAASGCLS